jgi:hypothetical protein
MSLDNDNANDNKRKFDSFVHSSLSIVTPDYYTQHAQKCMRCGEYLWGDEDVTDDPIYRNCCSHAYCVGVVTPEIPPEIAEILGTIEPIETTKAPETIDPIETTETKS